MLCLFLDKRRPHAKFAWVGKEGTEVSCRKCGIKGHNKRTCTYNRSQSDVDNTTEGTNTNDAPNPTPNTTPNATPNTNLVYEANEVTGNGEATVRATFGSGRGRGRSGGRG